MVTKIEKFYTREVGEILLFGYVTAFRKEFPAIKLDSAFLTFMKHFEVEDLNLETMRTTYYRMEKEYMEVRKAKV